jgi:hypothetical protein
MTFFNGNFRKIDLLHHLLPLSAGEILPFFVATSKRKGTPPSAAYFTDTSAILQ